MNATPIVDRVLTDSLAIPPGLDVWLRAVERRARSLRNTLERCALDPLVIARVDQVHRQVDALLERESVSPLHRLLRRPLAQIGPGTPAARAFDAYTTRLFRQAEEVLEAQAGIAAVVDQISALRSEHGRRMPHFTELLLGRDDLRDEAMREVRRPSDVRMLLRRVEDLDLRLHRLSRHLPPPDHDERVFARDHEKRVSTAELWAALQLRLDERRRVENGPDPVHGLRLLQADQLRRLGRAGGWERSARTLTHAAAEQLAQFSMEAGSEVAYPGSDTGLWTALLQAADRARFSALGPDAWQPRISAAPTGRSADESADSTVYVVAIADGFAYLSREFQSPVRLWSRTAREGEVVEARVFGPSGSIIATERVATDIAPMFDGAALNEPAWYATQRRATLLVLGEYRHGWFARLQSRGAVRRLNVPAWQDGEGTATAVRVFESDRSASAERVLLVGVTEPEAHRFIGIDTYQVSVPRLGCRTAWLRTAGGSRSSQQEALGREQALFRALRRRSPELAARPLGLGQLPSGGKPGFLYASPLGLRATGRSVAAEWLREDPLPMLRAVFRTALAAHETGYALGVYHLDLFAFGLEPWGESGRVRPRATLVAAPLATRLGHSFTPPGTGAGLDPPEYPHLGFRGFAPAVQHGDVALPDLDLNGLALMCLEAMIDRPISSGVAQATWAGLPARIRQHATRFVDADLARRIADALSPQGSAAALRSLLEKALAEASEPDD